MAQDNKYVLCYILLKLWKKLEKTYGKCYNRNCVIMRNCEKIKIKTYERGKK